MSDTLPPGWARTRIGDVCDVVGGSTPRTGIADNWGDDVPWVTPDDLSRHEGTYIRRGRRSLTQLGYESCSATLIPSGAVIFSSRAPIGYVAIASGPVCTNQGCKSFVPPEGLLSEYLYWYLRHATPAIQTMGTGTTFREISKATASSIQLEVPPLAEQKRIVVAIEEHFSRLDAADATLASAKQKVASVRRSAVARLFDHADWPWTTLGEIAEIKGGVTKDSKRQSDPSYVEVPYLRVANVQRGFLDLSEVSQICVRPAKAAQLALRTGDVLFNEGGDRDKLGRGWVWEGQIDDCIHQNHVFRARLSGGDFDPYFVSVHGNTWGQRWFETHGKHTTNLARWVISGSTAQNRSRSRSPPLSRSTERLIAEDWQPIQAGSEERMRAADSDERDKLRLRHSAPVDSRRRDSAGRLVPQDPDR